MNKEQKMREYDEEQEMNKHLRERHESPPSGETCQLCGFILYRDYCPLCGKLWIGGRA